MSDIGADRFKGTGDVFYDMLRDAHQGLSFEESATFNARLVLVLANLVSDPETLQQALQAAK